jgi:NTP pyrophosphatase (non-canonical NTP hydrolase)
MDLRKAQKDVYQNKIDKGFNTTDLPKEFCYLYGEVTEAYEAYTKKKDDLSHELADVAIYLLGISEILGIDLEKAIEEKIEINRKRVYKLENGIHVKINNQM